jgi:hypothetical protein
MRDEADAICAPASRGRAFLMGLPPGNPQLRNALTTNVFPLLAIFFA